MHRWGFNRQTHSRNKNSYVTNCIRLFKTFDFLCQSGGYDILKNAISPTHPYNKCWGGRTQFGNFIQRLASILIGKEDLNDHDTIDDDPALLPAVGLSERRIRLRDALQLRKLSAVPHVDSHAASATRPVRALRSKESRHPLGQRRLHPDLRLREPRIQRILTLQAHLWVDPAPNGRFGSGI